MFKNQKFSSTETSSFNTLYRQLSLQKFFALELHKTAKIAELFFKLPSTQPPFLIPWLDFTTLRDWTLHDFMWLDFTRLYVTGLYTTGLYATGLYVTGIYATGLYATLRYATWLYTPLCDLTLHDFTQRWLHDFMRKCNKLFWSSLC